MRTMDFEPSRAWGSSVKPRGLACLLWMTIAFLASEAAAQDAHYWSLHYGPIGQLLGGTTVGGVNDLSSTFYNPGALALIDDPRFLISFDSLQISSLKVENGAGEGLDLTNTNIRSIPRIVAGDFNLDALGNDRLARLPATTCGAFLSRQDSAT